MSKKQKANNGETIPIPDKNKEKADDSVNVLKHKLVKSDKTQEKPQLQKFPTSVVDMFTSSGVDLTKTWIDLITKILPDMKNSRAERLL